MSQELCGKMHSITHKRKKRGKKSKHLSVRTWINKLFNLYNKKHKAKKMPKLQ